MQGDARGPRVLVTGAGGFIGSHLGRFLRSKGYWVRGADIQRPEFIGEGEVADEFLQVDLRLRENCRRVTESVEGVYNLAANMGGIGFITKTKAEVMRDNVLINAHILEACRMNGVSRLFFSSSACIYPTYRQEIPAVAGLREGEAYPADPDNEYGWEKLFTERLCRSFQEDFGLEVRIARYHNIFGPYGTWEGGREKAPAALCRKVAMAEDGGEIEIWGDGRQTRSFCFIQDCLEGTYRLMNSDVSEPLNIGSDRLVTINEMVDIIIGISGKRIRRKYLPDRPQGVRGRNSDNTLVKDLLGWTPEISLEEGLHRTYVWIEEQVRAREKEALEGWTKAAHRQESSW